MTATEHSGAASGLTTRRARGANAPPGFPEMIDALRTLQDRITAAAPPEDLVADVRATLTDLATRLEPLAVGEREQITGHLVRLSGRGQAMAPVVHVDEADGDRARGRVTFGRFYLGGNGAVHGGAIPLVFDEIMGRLANSGDRRPSRTAYLHVDYRSITPIEAELRIEAWFDREEGRKRFLKGTLRHGDTLCAEAEGLFVELRPGQP